jgi:ribonuclease VapC
VKLEGMRFVEPRLNFGDCMAYAVAKLAHEPLLCTGRDFPKTDLRLA